MLETVKPAEDGSGDLIMRLFEPMNSTAECCLKVNLPSSGKAYIADMLETKLSSVEMRDNVINLDFKPFEIKTVRIEKL